MAEVRAGRGSGPAHLREALALITEPTARAQAARDVAHALVHAGEPGEALAVLTAVADEIVGAIDPQLALMLEGERCSLGLFNPATAEAAVNVAVPLARGLRGDPPGGYLLRAVLAITQGSVGEQGTTLPEAVCTAERALGGELAGDRIFDAPVLYGVLDTLISAEHLEQAEQALELAIAVAHSRGSLPSFALASSWQAHAHWFRGQLREAEAEAADALRVAGDAAARLTVPMAAGVLVGALLDQGKLEEAETTLVNAGLTEALPADVLAVFFVLYHRGRLRLAQGRTRDGLRDLTTLQHLRDLAGWAFAGMQPGVAATNALVAADEREHARELVNEELRIARRRRAPPVWEGAALRALACTQNGPAAIETLRASANALERSACLLERTRTLLELGAALRRSNQRTASRDPLRRALEFAHRCGANSLEEQTREELRACGARPRRVMLSGLESLTASELRVARMAARGLTNTEIAQQLFVTRKTVEVHLSNAYRKLDIRSRRQLPTALET
jgi:DNA-binding NarL/FixJ family response regulator